MIRTVRYQLPSPKITPYGVSGEQYVNDVTYYEHSEKRRKTRYSPLCLFLCICCTLFLIGIIVAAILMALLIKRDGTATTTARTTATVSTRRSTKLTSNGTTTIVYSTSSTDLMITTETLCIPTCPPDKRCVQGTCVGTGALSFTLTWSRPGDGDIVVKTPENKVIYYGNKGPSVDTSNGWLDADDQQETGPENVYWANNGTSPPAGTYHVCFSQYNFTTPASPTNPITATIKIEKPPDPVAVFTKTFRSPHRYTQQCDPTDDHFITSMTYP